MMKYYFIFILLLSILEKALSAYVYDNPVRDRCRIFEFRCANTKCIPLPLKCNGKDDCGDSSDETCDKLDKFQCDDGISIPKNKLCDGFRDCGNDEDLTICEEHRCSKDHFLCRQIPMRCIDINSVCNNIKDCLDDSDESPDACEFLRNSKLVECNNATQFRCANKQLCISKIYRCDNNDDCVDKSDEQNCPAKKNVEEVIIVPDAVNVTAKCSVDEFDCGSESPTGCISKDWVCDSSYDCELTKKDEINCPNFRCPLNIPNKCLSDDICYENDKRCDGQQNCPDASDEAICDQQKHNVTCDERTEFKCFKKNTCIPFDKVCDKFDDCGDNSDERPGGSIDNCLKTPCAINNGGCDQVCASFYSYRKCYCKSGYEISSTNQTKCIDINECSKGFTCSQICRNTEGSYQCDCFPGFYKSKINLSQCDAVGEKYLLFSSKDSIRELRLVHHHLEELAGVNDSHSKLQVIGLDFDYKTANIFWTQFEPYPAIVQFNSTNKRKLKQDLVRTRIHSPIGIAYDWIHGLLFWTDAFYREISVLNVSNGRRRVLLKFGNQSKLQSIVVHPKFRRIYWTDWGNKPRIMSVGIDGQDMKTIVEDGLITPNGLAIDYYLNELYWVDARARNIKSYHLKTGKQREVANYLNAHGFALDVFEDWLYLSDWFNESIMKIHKITGHRNVLVSASKPLGLKLMHQLAQPEHIENVCEDSPCQYFCMPSALNLKSGRHFQCQCPDNSSLMSDNKSCTPIKDNFENVPLVLRNRTSIQKEPTRPTTGSIYIIVGFVMATVTIVLVTVVVVGIFMYRNYLRQVIKRATNFNNPIYYRKTSTHDLQVLNSEYDIPAHGLHQGDNGLLMNSSKQSSTPN